MALRQSSEALRRPPRFLWLGPPILTVGALVLGYLGLHQFVQGNPDYSHQVVDILYYDLQLFFLGSDPLQDPGPYPLSLEIAKFCAPAVTVYTAFEAIRLLLAVELSRLRARRSRGHAIVCGDTAFADALSRRLRASGVEVVEIRLKNDEFVTSGEPLRVIGDGRDAEVLHEAGIDRALALYACTEDSATNIAVALAVARTVRADGPPLFTYSLISDPDLCASVQAFFLGQPLNRRVRADFFNIDDIAARRLVKDLALRPVDGRPPRLLLAGSDGFAQALLIEAARCWRSGAPGKGLMTVTMVGDRASAVVAELRRRFPVVDEVCRTEAVDQDLLTLMQDGRLAQDPDHVLVTHPDENHALMSALSAGRYWPGRPGRITVRLDGALIGVPTADGRLGVASADLRVFGAVGAAADPELIRDDLTERIARVLHDRYRRGRQARGDAREGTRALVSWEELPGQLRRANRTQAEDIGRKLSRFGYSIIPRQGGQPPTQLSEPEIDELARMEHDRWCQEQTSTGWRYAPEFDEQQQLHPGLLSWPDLPSALRLRNYDPIRELPAILADAGFQIVHT
jgi:TrkA-N domain/RyR domain